MEAIVDAHQKVLSTSGGNERPLLSTSMNGQIYLHRQPATRRKRVLAVSADDPGAPWNKLQGPPHDIEAIIATLIETGLSQSDVITLHNPDRRQIEKTIADIARAFRQQSHGEASGRLAVVAPTSNIHVGPIPLEETSAPNTLFLFFFSGHGVTVGATEYIIPKLPPGLTLKDFENSAKATALLAQNAISLNWLKNALERSAAASVIILDTHFPAIFRRSS